MVLSLVLYAASERHYVFDAHAGLRSFVIAAQIHQGLEGVLLAAGKQPVNQALFVDLTVIFEKTARDIAA